MAEIGDVLKEFHDAKPSEKLLIVGISIAALGIAIYIHSKTSTSTTPTNPVGGAAGTPGTVQPGGTPSNGQPVPPGTPTPQGPPSRVLLPPAPKPKPTGSPPPKRVLMPHPISGGTVLTRTAQRSAPIHGTTAVVTRSTYIPLKAQPVKIIGTGRTRMPVPTNEPHGHTGITNPYGFPVGQPATYAGNPGGGGALPTHGRVA